MRQQLVNLRLRKGSFDKTFQYDLYQRIKYEIHLTVGTDGTIDLEVRFIKDPNGLVYCKIYTLYDSNHKSEIYNQPIVAFDIRNDKPWKHFDEIKSFINGDSDLTATAYVINEKTNETEQYEFTTLGMISLRIDVEFVDLLEQQEADIKYPIIKQQEEYYEMHKTEIDTMRALAAAYDRQQIVPAIYNHYCLLMECEHGVDSLADEILERYAEKMRNSCTKITDALYKDTNNKNNKIYNLTLYRNSKATIEIEMFEKYICIHYKNNRYTKEEKFDINSETAEFTSVFPIAKNKSLIMINHFERV